MVTDAQRAGALKQCIDLRTGSVDKLNALNSASSDSRCTQSLVAEDVNQLVVDVGSVVTKYISVTAKEASGHREVLAGAADQVANLNQELAVVRRGRDLRQAICKNMISDQASREATIGKLKTGVGSQVDLCPDKISMLYAVSSFDIYN